MADTVNVLFLAAEAEPFVKVGGLADVAGSLPGALRELSRFDVRLVLPLHPAIRGVSATLQPLANFTLRRKRKNLPVQVFGTSLAGMPVYFVDGGPISAAASVYSPDPKPDREKYAFFSLAALEMLRHLDWQPDLVHANDWHTALALYALRLPGRESLLPGIRTVMTLHNLPYMGGDGADVLAAYGLPPLADESLPGWAGTQPLPLGLWAADAVVPVSPTYGREILTPDFGCGLDDYLRSRAETVAGILNGLDLASWNPQTDKTIPANFSAETLPKRAANKAALQRQLGLEENPRLPLLAMVGRIDPQKGVDVALEALRRIEERDWQFVLLGTGDPALETAVQEFQADFPGRVRAALRYDAALGRLIYSGADLLLMPSRYEPCGLAQMIAMRYGCLPLVRATGGLKDTVEEGRTGFLFPDAEAGSMAAALERALVVYDLPGEWTGFQRSGMGEDFSWSRSAGEYARLYEALIAATPPPVESIPGRGKK